MSLTNQQFRNILKDMILERKTHERQTISENLEKEGYSRYDYDDYAPDNDDPDSGRHGSDNYTIGAYNDQVPPRKPNLFQRKSTVKIHSDLKVGGREDALAGLPMNGRYSLRPEYIAAYEKALAAKDEPMSRKGLDEGCGDMPMAEPEMEDEELSFTGDVGELSGDEAFAVGWTAALEQARSTIEGLLGGVDGVGSEELPAEEEIVVATEEY